MIDKKKGFMILGVVVLIAFLFILSNEPSTSSITDALGCFIGDCEEANKDQMTNVMLLLLVVGAAYLMKKEGIL